MAKVESLSAYKCTFSYLLRNNPLKEELHDKIKSGISPEYSFTEFIDDFSRYTSSLAIGENSDRAILLPDDRIYPYDSNANLQKWRIVPFVGKQGVPLRIIKTDTGKAYDYNSKSAALYEHNIFLYQDKPSLIAIFHRKNRSGCKSVFLEVANKILKKKGLRINMELYVPLCSLEDKNIVPTKIQLQYVRSEKTSDRAENIRKKRRPEIIQELGLNLESIENSPVRKIIEDFQMKKCKSDVAFAKIKESYPNSDIYNDAEIYLRIGKRRQKIRWDEFDSIMGNYDITEQLHRKFRESGDYIKALTEISDEYCRSILSEEKSNGE